MDIYYLPEEFRDDRSPPHKRKEERKKVLEEIKKFLDTLKFGWAIRIHTSKGMFSGQLGEIGLDGRCLHWKFLSDGLSPEVAKKIPTSIKLRKVVGFIIFNRQR